MKKDKMIYIFFLIFLILFFSFIYFFIKLNKNDNNIKNESTQITNTDVSNSDKEDAPLAINQDQFQEATVKRIVDGDTIVVLINDKEYKVRFIGINTPESTTKKEYFGKEASEYTKSSLTSKTIYLQKDVSETDKYGRLLRYIWLEIPESFSEDEIREKMFNAKLVLDGYAKQATYPPDVKFADYFKKFANEAMKNSVGLWKK